MKALKFILFSFIICLLAIYPARATHIRAGEITAKRISNTSLTYRVTLTTYTDQINGVTANEGQNTVNFYFGVTGVPLYTLKRKKKTLNPHQCSERRNNFSDFPGLADHVVLFVFALVSLQLSCFLNLFPKIARRGKYLYTD